MIEIPTSSSRKDVLTVAREAALMAGEILMDRYRSTLKVAYKGRGNIVTDVDLMVEKAVFDFLGKEHTVILKQKIKLGSVLFLINLVFQ